MNSVNFRYSPGNLLYIALLTPLFAAIGSLLVIVGKPLAVIVGGIFFTVAGILFWKLLTIPRVVHVDLRTGLATFLAPRWLARTNRIPIQIRDFSNIYAALRKPGVTYYVAVSNSMGESATLLSCVDAEEAEKACNLLGEHFGLINRGLN